MGPAYARRDPKRFAQDWRVDSIELDVTVRSEPVRSWLATITRT